MLVNAVTFGVEEEFLVVDGQGHLSYLGEELAAGQDKHEGELHRELSRCQVESATGVCTMADEVRAQLTDLRRRLAERAHARGLRLVPSGTPLLPERAWPDVTPESRYLHIAEQFGPIMTAGSTCGCHVHVAVPDRATGVAVSNQLRPWLPTLLAITANSPLSRGTDTAYASWRHVLWSRWPSAGPPPLFDSLDHYEHSVDALLRCGAMVDDHMVYWDIRLSAQHPTLEFRPCDVAVTAEHAALLAVLVRGLVGRAVHDLADGRPAPRLPHEVLRAHLWRAARDGMTGQLAHPATGDLVPAHEQALHLVGHIRPALRGSGDLDFVREQLADLREHGGGAERQRRTHARRGRIEDVVDGLVTGQLSVKETAS
ncbi:glutamate--cysteine ligase [Kutzneria viridogrisea]|uniref:Putative glutamate--cysteine ligase 2 n=2 Tax=Kutzneria TaxID=43356 RepID=W5WB56_9PSEU|nr:glutamate--cysteine ligase [Kutzneria albida]AHH98000.1 hypothetical protein KALB_4638 [Kutzneria albida DSM 43870]MBA8924343.1 carboxylate-amine ligase [Kutzneria viridogrisea]